MNIRQRKAERQKEMLRRLSQEGGNKYCFDCDMRGPLYIVSDFSILVCSGCSAVHRSFQHKVKGITMSEFTDDEIARFMIGGNDTAETVWLNTFKGKHPRSGDVLALKDFIRATFVDRQYCDRAAYAELLKKWENPQETLNATTASSAAPAADPARVLPPPPSSDAPANASVQTTPLAAAPSPTAPAAPSHAPPQPQQQQQQPPQKQADIFDDLFVAPVQAPVLSAAPPANSNVPPPPQQQQQQPAPPVKVSSVVDDLFAGAPPPQQQQPQQSPQPYDSFSPSVTPYPPTGMLQQPAPFASDNFGVPFHSTQMAPQQQQQIYQPYPPQQPPQQPYQDFSTGAPTMMMPQQVPYGAFSNGGNMPLAPSSQPYATFTAPPMQPQPAQAYATFNGAFTATPNPVQPPPFMAHDPRAPSSSFPVSGQSSAGPQPYVADFTDFTAAPPAHAKHARDPFESLGNPSQFAHLGTAPKHTSSNAAAEPFANFHTAGQPPASSAAPPAPARPFAWGDSVPPSQPPQQSVTNAFTAVPAVGANGGPPSPDWGLPASSTTGSPHRSRIKVLSVTKSNEGSPTTSQPSWP